MDLKNSMRPVGDATTVIDIADRDDMDDDMFPLAATKSWFTRTESRRVLPFSAVTQEFAYIGSAEFGGTLEFELGSVDAGDLIGTIALQVRLGHWLPDNVLEGLQSGIYEYTNPLDAWYYANCLGTVLLAKAEFLLEDQTLETVDGDFSNLFSVLWTDINTQFGPGIDGYGRANIANLVEWHTNYQTSPFPTSNGFITVLLPFSFQRIRLRNMFPLLSCKDGTIRVRINLRPFSECVRVADGIRATCNETPLGKTFTFIDKSTTPNTTFSVVASTGIPQFRDARLVTYGFMVDGKLRTALLKAPFERMYREIQSWYFSEPKKYVVNTPINGCVRLQLPLEINGPCEEILWFIRRKAVSVNNEWTNYSNRLESEWEPTYRPFESMLIAGSLWVNGTPFIEAEGEFFRREISKAHPGGIVGYNNFVYGYSFAARPGKHDPSGWVNASRSQDIRLRLDIRPPNGSEDLEFEVYVYCIGLNWVRFENGIANKVFSS